MDTLLEWLTLNPVAIWLLILLALLIVGSVAMLLYRAIFIEGREVTLWPPKFGAKPVTKQTEQNDETSSVVSTQELRKMKRLTTNPLGLRPFGCVRLVDFPTYGLYFIDGVLVGHFVAITTKEVYEFTMGRLNEADVVIDGQDVSRKHCRINVEPENNAQFVTITDLGSTNGTFVNSSRLHPYDACMLREGDLVRVGFSTAVFRRLDRPLPILQEKANERSNLEHPGDGLPQKDGPHPTK